MYKKIFINFNFKKFIDAEYVEYETQSMKYWHENNKGSPVEEFYGLKLPETYCWENTRMKQLVWNLEEVDTESLAKLLKMEIASISSIMQPPGSIIPVHVDSFFQLKKNFPNRPNPVRALIFMQDWKLGHFLQCNDDGYSKWKTGEGIIVSGDQLHLSANAGVENKYTLQVSGFVNE